MIQAVIVILVGLYIAFLLALMILFHELGHGFTMAIYGIKNLEFRKVGKIGIGITGEGVRYLSPRKKQLIAFNGILAGMIPLLIFSSGFVFYILLLLYMAGVSKDIAVIVRGAFNGK